MTTKRDRIRSRRSARGRHGESEPVREHHDRQVGARRRRGHAHLQVITTARHRQDHRAHSDGGRSRAGNVSGAERDSTSSAAIWPG